jgi:hypothetical protein
MILVKPPQKRNPLRRRRQPAEVMNVGAGIGIIDQFGPGGQIARLIGDSAGKEALPTAVLGRARHRFHTFRFVYHETDSHEFSGTQYQQRFAKELQCPVLSEKRWDVTPTDHFEPLAMERVWGGRRQKLSALPQGVPVGESQVVDARMRKALFTAVRCVEPLCDLWTSGAKMNGSAIRPTRPRF